MQVLCCTAAASTRQILRWPALASSDFTNRSSWPRPRALGQSLKTPWKLGIRAEVFEDQGQRHTRYGDPLDTWHAQKDSIALKTSTAATTKRVAKDQPEFYRHETRYGDLLGTWHPNADPMALADVMKTITAATTTEVFEDHAPFHQHETRYDHLDTWRPQADSTAIKTFTAATKTKVFRERTETLPSTPARVATTVPWYHLAGTEPMTPRQLELFTLVWVITWLLLAAAVAMIEDQYYVWRKRCQRG